MLTITSRVYLLEKKITHLISLEKDSNSHTLMVLNSKSSVSTNYTIPDFNDLLIT